jgi:hypothetical protein
MKRIRLVLAQPKGVARLIGLSGMGKTRLVQALFDDRVGGQALDPTLALYTDLGDQPDPSPRDLVRHLVQSRQRAIIVVDNCPPETHGALVQICNEPESAVSLITVEYDVRDDDPESTEVFRLEPASDEVIDHILERQAPQLSQLDRRRITEFSSGNARVALALAHTVGRGESVSNLSSRSLFNRLFHQGRPEDEGLMRAAEACSFVYSFNGEALDGKDAEIPLLAEIADLPIQQFDRCVNELRARGLIQQRGPWRALLPHALANMLAKQALERMPQSATVSFFQTKASERLLKSFSRRLGYLHDSEPAVRIVHSWLSNGGLLSELHNLSELGLTMFHNIAPVAPEAVLDAVERTAKSEHSTSFFNESQYSRTSWTALLRSIAYEPNLFSRAAQLLSRFVVAKPLGDRNDSARERFKNLFQLYLSGTHALIARRLEVVDWLLTSDDERMQTCGLDALKELLEGEYFSSSHEFEFGARPRDYGWAPQTHEEVVSWYSQAIGYAQSLVLSDHPRRGEILHILADKFRGIWSKTDAVEPLETMIRSVNEKGYWPEGWLAVLNTIRHNADDMSPAHLSRLRAVEELLRPRDLLQKARAYVFSEPWGSLDVASGEQKEVGGNDISAALSRVLVIVKDLGREIADNKQILEQLLPEIVSDQKMIDRVGQFGEGLAMGKSNLGDMWHCLVDAVASAPEKKRNIQVLKGFLYTASTRDREITATFLDAAIDDPILGPWFPSLQMSLVMDQEGARRLEKSLQLGLAPSWTYGNLWHYWRDSISTDIFRRLIHGIALLPKGYDFAVESLSMWLHTARDSKRLIDKQIVLCGRELIQEYTFERSDRNGEYHLSEIIDACFLGEDAVKDAIAFCHKIKEAVKEYRLYPSTHYHLFESLFRTQPVVALNEFVCDDPANTRMIINEIDQQARNPLNVVPTDVLISWAKINSPIRYPRLAGAVNPIERAAGGEIVLSEVALKVLNEAPDKLAILTVLGKKMLSYGWRASRSDTVNTYDKLRTLPQAFFADADPRVVAWAQEYDAELARLAEKERAGERRTDESFE